MKHWIMRSACVGVAVLGLARSAWAWNSTGHESVALVAYDQLSADDRTKLAEILKAHPRYKKDLLQNLQPGDDEAAASFITAATWPDIVRDPTNPLQSRENHPIWHYVDYPYDLDGVKGPVPVTDWDGKTLPQNLAQAMQKVTAEFVDPKTSAPRRAIDLCWVEHLIGDIHQPLHAVSLYSKQYPEGDRGGNSVFFLPAEIDPNTGDKIPTNLHHYWDGLMGYKLNLADIRLIADRVEHEHPPASLAEKAKDLNVLDFAQESHDIAVPIVYCDGKIPGVPRAQARDNPDAVPPLTDAYQTKAHEVGDMRVALGGYRLANELHKLLTATPTTATTAATMP